MSDIESVIAGARRGLMIVLSSPSGAGKTTLSRSLIDSDDALSLSISATTRMRRPSEADGVHYHFMTERQFARMRDDGELIEWAEVHGNHYGTPREPVEKVLREGRDILFDIDWQGTQQLRQAMGDDVVSIFILPPSADELENRLKRRAEDSAPVIERRLKNGAQEIGHWDEYDYTLVNRDFEVTLNILRAILAAERLRRFRQIGLGAYAENLIGELQARVSDSEA